MRRTSIGAGLIAIALTAVGCGATTRNGSPSDGDPDEGGSGGAVSSSSGSGGKTASGSGGKTVGGSGSATGGSGNATGGSLGKPVEPACKPKEPAARAPEDPGVPGTMYGPIMGGTARAGDDAIELVGTAAAVAVPNGSHLFFSGNPTDAALLVYMSIVVADPAWAPGVYTKALAGALEVVTRDDCSYRLDLASVEAGSSSFRLEVTAATQQGNDFYLRGTLDAELSSLDDRPAMSLHMTIN